MQQIWQRFLNKTFRSFPKETHTQTRWGIFQLFISFALFCIACWIALLSIYITFGGGCIVGIYLIVTASILLVVGIGSAIYAFYLAGKYLDAGSQDPTATKEDIVKLSKTITKLIKEIQKDRMDKKGL